MRRPTSHICSFSLNSLIRGTPLPLPLYAIFVSRASRPCLFTYHGRLARDTHSNLQTHHHRIQNRTVISIQRHPLLRVKRHRRLTALRKRNHVALTRANVVVHHQRLRGPSSLAS